MSYSDAAWALVGVQAPSQPPSYPDRQSYNPSAGACSGGGPALQVCCSRSIYLSVYLGLV
jgi:hypothetical protein